MRVAAAILTQWCINALTYSWGAEYQHYSCSEAILVKLVLKLPQHHIYILAVWWSRQLQKVSTNHDMVGLVPHAGVQQVQTSYTTDVTVVGLAHL